MNPNEPIQIYYGGWAVEGKELALQWSTAIVVELMIDEKEIDGVLQPESHELPNNCATHGENIFWLYHMVVIPGLSAGEHTVVVTIKSLRAVADGSGIRYGPGTISRDKFYVTTR